MDTHKIDCNDYRNDPILLINSTYWKAFSESGCNLKAAIIKMDNDLRNRISSPLSSSSAHVFPIILMYNSDEEILGTKRELRIRDVEVSIVFKNDDIKFKVPCEDNCTR